jgi:hypothetical protein
MFDLLLDRLNINAHVIEMNLKFNQNVYLIKGHSEASGVDWIYSP